MLIIAAFPERSLFSGSGALYAGLIAKSVGARHVTLVDARPHVRSHAERLGLTTATPHELAGLDRAALVVEATGTPRGLRAALESTANDGICTSMGGLHNTARIPTGMLYGRNVTFHLGRAHARTLIPKVLELMAHGLRPETVTTNTGGIDEAPHLLAEHVHDNTTKTILIQESPPG